MKEYTYSEARQQLTKVMEEAKRMGSVRIRRRDGQVFVLRPETPTDSPLDVGGVNLGLSRDEIVSFVKEGRRED
jgi:hypothetical protein